MLSVFTLNGEAVTTTPPTLPQDREELVNGELSIRSVVQSDSGMYTCVAENKYGAIYSNAELKVLGKYPTFGLFLCLFQVLSHQTPTLGLLCVSVGAARHRAVERGRRPLLFSQTNCSLSPPATLGITLFPNSR